MKILENHPTFEQCPPRPPQTGILRAGNTWRAIRNGKLVGEFEGVGSKAAAIKVAGTNRAVA